jgi:hypothetical protein
VNREKERVGDRKGSKEGGRKERLEDSERRKRRKRKKTENVKNVQKNIESRDGEGVLVASNPKIQSLLNCRVCVCMWCVPMCIRE